jgi:aryl-alcohol dehydrogenase-like predicted oxidoreductase
VIERAEFGRTGHRSTRVIFGAAGLASMRQERADAVLDVLLEFGVNHLDTAASYGESELRIAPWLRDRRRDFFLATKTGDRTGDAARASLERSLERLGVDQVDLIQLHDLVDEDDWATAHGPGGAGEALAKARDEGLARFVGVTGHGIRVAAMHLRSLERYDFDSVLLPYNFSLLADDAYRGDVELLLERCAERRVAVQGIKSVARRRWHDRGPHFSWYEPLPEGPALDRAVRFLLGQPQLFLLTSSDVRLLRPTLTAADSSGEVPSDADLLADADEHAIRPLFDWGERQRV